MGQHWIACLMVTDIQTFLEITLLLADLGKSMGRKIILLLKEPSFLTLAKFLFWLALVIREKLKIMIF